jgi:aryl-alcohol dehydrogenase-like predicted oxidoreductase
MRTAFVARPGQRAFPLAPPPDVSIRTLAELPDQMARVEMTRPLLASVMAHLNPPGTASIRVRRDHLRKHLRGRQGGIMRRREALEAMVAAAVTSVAGGETAAGGESGAPRAAASAGGADMPFRTLGRTGEKVSAIGLGGHHIGRPPEASEGIRIIRTAIDRGITFMDNCWDYHDGESERRMGQALRDGYRQRVFLMTKFDGRTKAATVRQIDESLRRLQTDTVDLMQYHENIRMEDPDRFFAADGPLEALLEAKKAGKIRYIGFTGHKDPVVHLRMLEVAEARGFAFDACQMPLNPMDAHFRSFEKDVLPRLVQQGIGVLGMKSMGDGLLLKSGTITAVECLQYALNLPTSVVITGFESLERLDQAIEAVRGFRPLSPEQVAAILAKTRSAALTGQFELFKTTERFDGTAKNPHWMS